LGIFTVTSQPSSWSVPASPRDRIGDQAVRRAGCQTRPVPSRRLLLVRHARAADGPVDAERPLTDEGARQADAVGAWIAQAGLVPERVLVSPARRAEQTWERASAALGSKPRPVAEPRIHDNTVDALLAAVRETPEEITVLVVVGHNPSVGELARALDDGTGDPSARRGVGAGFPAGGVAVFHLAVPFAAIAPGGATLDDFTAP
jgi:phosphohistidine phosphatase